MIYIDQVEPMSAAEIRDWKPRGPSSRQRDRQLAELKAASPLRSASAQHDVDGLALFDVARQPNLF